MCTFRVNSFRAVGGTCFSLPGKNVELSRIEWEWKLNILRFIIVVTVQRPARLFVPNIPKFIIVSKAEWQYVKCLSRVFFALFICLTARQSNRIVSILLKQPHTFDTVRFPPVSTTSNKHIFNRLQFAFVYAFQWQSIVESSIPWPFECLRCWIKGAEIQENHRHFILACDVCSHVCLTYLLWSYLSIGSTHTTQPLCAESSLLFVEVEVDVVWVLSLTHLWHL